MRRRQPFDRRVQWQPFQRLDVSGEPPSRRARRLHSPKMDELWPAAGKVIDHPEEFAHGHIVPGFLGGLALRRRDGALLRLQLSLGKNPTVILAALDHGYPRSRTAVQHDSSSR